MGVSRSPLIPLRPEDMHEVPIGVPIASLAPDHPDGALLLRVNGDYMLRESWASETRHGDVIEWHTGIPQDKEAVRGALQVVSIVASFFFPAFAPYALAANFAYNLLVPPSIKPTPASPQQTGDALGTSLAGNQARIDQPIWKICGRREINPPFAAQPYQVFLPKDDATDPQLDREQYYYALFAVGVGNHDIAGVKIGNTPISRFRDVLVAQYLAPGVQPSVVKANVSTADEVSSLVLESGLYVGGFAACAPLESPSSIGIDVVATRGLGKTDALTVTWRVEQRPINEFGQVLGPWVSLASESRTAFTATPQRWSNEYTLPTPGRVEIRVVRTDPQDTDPSALHEIAWSGLRSYLSDPAPLNEHTAHYEIVLRASSQLSSVSSRDVRLISEGYVRTLNADLEWQPETHSRTPAWWILDLATSPIWGLGKPDSRVDLQSFYDLAQINDARQDRFDWTFDSSINAWDAMQLIARTCRSRVFRRNGVLSVARDQLADVPVTAFTPRNCLPGMQISERLPQRATPDGIIVEYQDYRTNEWKEIECPCPGVSEILNPIHKRMEGVVGPTHAEREGIYEAANLVYRTRTVGFTTEMQGLLPAYMSPVDFVADMPSYGMSGDVAFWDADTFVMGLTEQPDWTKAPLFLTLRRDDGSSTDDVEVMPGPTANDIVLPSAPDFELVLDDGTRERPTFRIGPKDIVKIVAISDGGKTDDGAQLYSLSGVIDDERVHDADVHLLPGPGDIQDPVGNPDDLGDDGGDLLYITYLTEHSALDQYFSAYEVGPRELEAAAIFSNNGLLTLLGSSEYLTDPTTFTNQWILHGEVEPTVAASFEIRATLLSSASANGDEVFTGTMDTWVSLASSQTWSLTRVSIGDFWNIATERKIKFEVRVAGDAIIQSSANITLTVITVGNDTGA